MILTQDQFRRFHENLEHFLLTEWYFYRQFSHRAHLRECRKIVKFSQRTHVTSLAFDPVVETSIFAKGTLMGGGDSVNILILRALLFH